MLIPFFSIEGSKFQNSWVRACRFIVNFGFEYETEFGNRAKGVALSIQLDRDAIQQIENLQLHPQFPTKDAHLQEYLKQFDRTEVDRFKGFDYVYLKRFVDYNGLDQLKEIQRAIKKVGSRRCQLITWQPKIDLFEESVPCLQLIQLFNLDGKHVQAFLFFRSNDMYSAWMSNLCGIVWMLNKYILHSLELSRINYFCSNSHVYEEFFEEVKKLKLDPKEVYNV